MENLDEYFKVCLDLTKEAGQVIREAIVKSKQIQTKSSDIDLVTETDQQVEKLLIGGLQKNFPDHKFIGEESTAVGQKCVLTDDPTWIIDPVDGTMNFVHGLPLVAISIGLLIKKTPVIGIIYNPILDQLYTARLGQGAFLNGKPIRVSGTKDLSQALVCSEAGTSKDPEKKRVVLNNLGKLIGSCHGLRQLGTAACSIGMVACGGADAFCHMGIHCWDLAAGQLIVEEAGGCMRDYSGGPLDLMNRRVICASSEELAKQLSEILEQFEMERD
jgi:myo-inositol-1(or 4)-monophosphatase